METKKRQSTNLLPKLFFGLLEQGANAKKVSSFESSSMYNQYIKENEIAERITGILPRSELPARRCLIHLLM
jgi:hypothetical protein